MKKLMQAITNLPSSTKQILFFGVIFTIYFMSSVGISNTIDGPQYFTTEMILQNASVNLSPAKKFAHFYSANDVSNKNGKIYSVRGFFHTVYSFPLHIIARNIEPFVNVSDFPKHISRDQNFKHELLTCSLFSIFSTLGLFFLFKAIKNSTQLNGLAYMMIVFTAFGTYIWKYSAFYVRQGILVFIFGLTIFAIQKYSTSNKKRWLLLLVAALYASMYGFDLPGFGAFIISTTTITALYLLGKYATLKKVNGVFFEFIDIVRNNIAAIIVFSIIVFINIILNYIFFNSFTYIQTVKLFENNKSFSGLLSFATGTPIFPTIWWILFGGSPLPVESLSHLIIKKEYISLFSVKFAMKYNFFGIFFVSPFLLYIFFKSGTLLTESIDAKKIVFGNFFGKMLRKVNFVIAFCVIYSLIYFLISVKNFAFYAANSFDIRYFYPIVIFLSYLTAVSLNDILQTNKNKKLFIFVFIALGLFSLIMGAVGIANAYGPYMSEERRIWIEIYNIQEIFTLPREVILNAFLPNRKNFFIPLIPTLTLASISLLLNKYRRIK